MHVSLISDESIKELTQGTDFTVTDRVVTLANATDLKIKIYRETTTKPLVGWADASVLRAADMTVQSTQLLHLAEETSDLAQDGGLSKDTTDNVWDARYNKIKNLLDPTDPGDAVTLSYITKKQTGLLTQLNATGDNQNTRLLTTGDAQNTRLVTTGDSYVTTMTTLKDTATAKAIEANNSADLAKKWAMADVSPDDVEGHKSSKTWAEEAKTSASNSAASASASKQSATASASSATNSANSANASKQSAIASANSASDAATSASNAKVSETNAAQSATEAAQSAENAKLWDNTNYYTKDQTYTKTEVDTKINGIFMEKKFSFTNKNVGGNEPFHIMQDYNIHVDGYKPLCFAEIHFNHNCSLEDYLWNEYEHAEVWGCNNINSTYDINTDIWVLYVKESFR